MIKELNGPIVEDPLYVRTNEKSVNKSSTGSGVVHLIRDFCPSIDLLKVMLVNPLSIGALDLDVYKSTRRVPDGDFRCPIQWDTAEREAVFNPSSYLHFDGLRASDAEAEPGWHDGFEIGWVGKERKNLL
jgi:hypothetical protein